MSNYGSGQEVRDALDATMSCLDSTDKSYVEPMQQKVVTYAKAADGMASTTTAETVIGKNPFGVVARIKSLIISPTATTATDETDYATLTFKSYTAAGASALTICAPATNAAGGGAWTALTNVTPTLTAASLLVPANGIFTMTIAKGGSGKIVPASVIEILLEPA